MRNIPRASVWTGIELNAKLSRLLSQLRKLILIDPDLRNKILSIGHTRDFYLKGLWHSYGSSSPMKSPLASKRTPRPSGARISVTLPKRA